MIELQDQPQASSNKSNQQAGDAAERSYQSQQQGREQRPQDDREQSGEEKSFTVSTDDWF